ncbi:thiol:disulfide interchange protein DsbD [Pedobacter sp. AK017]|uniref:protein-disulfide reductase DsbD domain-containing protein n=1 Tax=Pedobacter sp. AK017 TaxID=2723073 RepID=UPI001617CEA6|nr:protein-disulfide reductase DsbD domain-containing protein [Pedobacter sp. AK017]MBB5438507.1 thiol:disulfide interchange protein DsbD [Pedobacter sp. AK017]
MKKVLFIILGFVLLGVTMQAQILKPVKWSFTSVKKSPSIYEVNMAAVIKKGWHIYSQNTPDGGPLATKVTFAKNPLILLGGKTTELGKLHKEHSKEFGVEVWSYSDKVEFVQVVRMKKPGVKTILSGMVEFMACDESQCLPPEEIPFKIELK